MEGQNVESKAQHWLHSSWPQILIFLVVQIGGLVWFVATTQNSQSAMRDAVNHLSLSVDKLTEQANHISQTNERIEEHQRGLDRRLELIERDSQVKEWRKQQ